MRVIKRGLLVLIFLIISGAVYLGSALYTASWYPGLDMNTPYSYDYYGQKINNIIREFTEKPLEVVTFNMSEKECEGLLKSVLRMNPEIAAYVQGVSLSINRESLVLKTNLRLGSWNKGMELELKPVSDEKKKELAVGIERIRLGAYPLPVSPVLYFLEKAGIAQGLAIIKDNQIRISINNIPVALKYVRLESKQLVAGISTSTGELSKMAAGEKPLLSEALSQSEVLKKGLKSSQAIDFIESLKQKKELSLEDIDKAKAIYNSLSPEDKAVLRKNISEFLENPAVKEVFGQIGF
ncbi:MAG: hypothetical protein QHH10_07835 [Peptococcaceae bacterium]|nr:hypothetical protein [Peptococcaceae bacterium]MDH7525210.1 hypothetical protein [Peptococcaceae bacterium]